MRISTILFVALALGACKKKTPADEMSDADRTPVAPAVKAPEAPAHVKTMVENFSKVYFDLDSSDLSDESKSALVQNATIMQKHTDVKLRVEGHADERGTTDYNLALGQRRAETIRSSLIAEGIAPTRLAVVSMGEEVPAVDGHSESAWSKNRRAEFVVTWGGEGEVQGTKQ